MSTPETQWVLCTVCHGRARTRFYKTFRFSVRSPKCKRNFLISPQEYKTKYEIKPQLALTFDEIGQIADMYFDNEASIVLGIMLILGSLLCRYGAELRKHPGEGAQ